MQNNFICDRNLCTGCTACFNKCPVSAIKMEENDEGFLYPVIDENLCINCGLCKKICPVNNVNDCVNTGESLQYIAAAPDNVRKISSSGGMFNIVATYVLNSGGYVCGVVYDDNMNAVHILTNDKQDVLRMSGSKYVQSYPGNCFQQIKEKLDKNIKVLFTGCPCQVAGLKQYLNKEYENLITMDLICHGTPSPELLKKFLKEEYQNEKVLDVNFRYKKDNWGTEYNIVTKTDSGIYSNKINDHIYTKAFAHNMCLRISCTECQFAQKQRTGDFTIGDAWGANKIFKAKRLYKDKKGASILLVNNSKAKNLFNKLKKEFKQIIPVKNYSQPNMQYPSAKHPSRDDFFEKNKTMTFRKAFEETFCSKKNVAILNHCWENVNFGAVLTGYALNKVCKLLGYNAQTINYNFGNEMSENYIKNSLFDDFKRKYIDFTMPVINYKEFEYLNNYFDNFIVGSDQVWRYQIITKDNLEYFFLNFAKPEKNIISCAASFGIFDIDSELNVKFTKNTTIKDLYLKYLKNFDSISIREENGVEYCKKHGLNASLILDPVFLITKKDWEKLTDEDKSPKEFHKVAHYIINSNQTESTVNLAKQIIPDIQIDDFIKLNSKDMSIQNWLWQINNCEFFVTDSFHGCCFAIIFNKQFVCVNSNTKILARMESLFKMLGIENRLYKNFDEIDIEIIKQKINYEKVNKKIEEYSLFSKEWLVNALNKNITDDIVQSKIKIKNEIKNINKEYAKKHRFKYFIKYLSYTSKYLLSVSKKQKLHNKFKKDLFKLRHKHLKYIQ